MGEIFTDQSEWQISKGLNEQSLHLDLVQWADVFIISPLDANTLGKISSGICDNLLTCIARSWDLHKPLLFCPEMNTRQFLHPITNRQIEEIKNFGYYELPSISETLVTEGNGHGALSEINYIIDAIFNHVQSVQSQQQQQQHMTQTQAQAKSIYHQSLPSPLNDSKSSSSPLSAIFQAGLSGVVEIKQHDSEPLTFGEKPFTCDVCGGKFSRYSSLWSHKTLHTGELPWKCWPMSLKSTISLSQSFVGIKKFVCNICNASFAKANYLNNHKRIHTGWVKWFMQDLFANFLEIVNLPMKGTSHTSVETVDKASLSRRISRITNEFTRGEELKWYYEIFVFVLIRISLHSFREKPFTCEICQKTFARYSTLWNHRRIHTG